MIILQHNELNATSSWLQKEETWEWGNQFSCYKVTGIPNWSFLCGEPGVMARSWQELTSGQECQHAAWTRQESAVFVAITVLFSWNENIQPVIPLPKNIISSI